jgi:hypothetical protein
MASAPTPTVSKNVSSGAPHELRVYMHSWMLYWWPVWAVGYLMAAWTYIENQHMVLVPQGAEVVGNAVVAPEGAAPIETGIHVSPSRVPGLVFAITLLAVTAFGTGWLWGWRAFTFAAVLVAGLFLIGWLNVWDVLARWVTYLHVYISLGGYLVISSGLLVLWVVQVFVADRRTYVVFSLGQVRVHNEIGEEERAYDAGGVSFEKAPYDWFRWLVGFGAGDLRVKVRGEVIQIPNVVHVGRRLDAIEVLLRIKDVE